MRHAESVQSAPDRGRAVSVKAQVGMCAMLQNMLEGGVPTVRRWAWRRVQGLEGRGRVSCALLRWEALGGFEGGSGTIPFSFLLLFL